MNWKKKRTKKPNSNQHGNSWLACEDMITWYKINWIKKIEVNSQSNKIIKGKAGKKINKKKLKKQVNLTNLRP